MTFLCNHTKIQPFFETSAIDLGNSGNRADMYCGSEVTAGMNIKQLI